MLQMFSLNDKTGKLTELASQQAHDDMISSIIELDDNKIITSSMFPTFTDGSTHRIYCKRANASGLTPPQGWTFTYVN
jgi:hypothetical protein